MTFILEQLSQLENVSYPPMTGEFILYYQGEIFGGIYNGRLLVKPVKSGLAYMPEASHELPYPGIKEMLLVGNVDDKGYLSGLI